MRDDVPAPGSKEAVDNGCTCAIMDNCYGKGIGGDGARWGWWITQGCPLHAPEGNDEPTKPRGKR